jgi:hypothetical protein
LENDFKETPSHVKIQPQLSIVLNFDLKGKQQMMKKAMFCAVPVLGLMVGGCNTEGAIVIAGISAGLLGGVIELGELIAQAFGA